jgi:hypothetical protein
MGRVCGTHKNEEGMHTVYWWGKLKERGYLGDIRVVLGVSYEGRFNNHVFKNFGLWRGYVFPTAPSDPLTIRPPRDGRTEIKHCYNDNGETNEFAV